MAFGPELRLYEIKTRRKRKPSKEEHGKLLKDCQALAEELEKEAEPDGQNPDFRDSRPEAQRELLGEVCCTLGLLYWDCLLDTSLPSNLAGNVLQERNSADRLYG